MYEIRLKIFGKRFLLEAKQKINKDQIGQTLNKGCNKLTKLSNNTDTKVDKLDLKV